MIRVKMPVSKFLVEVRNGQTFLDSKNDLYLKLTANQLFCFATNTLVEKSAIDYSQKLTLVKITSARVMMNDEGEMSV